MLHGDIPATHLTFMFSKFCVAYFPVLCKLVSLWNYFLYNFYVYSSNATRFSGIIWALIIIVLAKNQLCCIAITLEIPFLLINGREREQNLDLRAILQHFVGYPSFYSLWNLDFHTDRQTDRRTGRRTDKRRWLEHLDCRCWLRI